MFCAVSTLLTSSAILLAAARPPRPPAPSGAVPSARQLAWHELEFYGFLHFTVNTFTDTEWGYGDEPESVFNPSALDARQWVRVAKDAGMKGLIITAKHHDGFVLWPSRVTEHSVKNSPWKGGRGDVVGELARACRESGLKFGVYLSPWDRNHKDYGRPEYLEYYRAQLRELLTSYGDVFEVWFDGANGGDGYYGGAREKRTIDGATYYDWANTWSLVRLLQPRAVMFSDAGPDVRWVGNERGVAFETSWNAIDLRGIYPGAPGYTKIAAGSPDGADWAPPEVDVSIRPGWFYHPAEDARVRSVDDLVSLYFSSVGRNSKLLLNVPPTRDGLLHDVDVSRLAGMRAALETMRASDAAAGARVQWRDAGPAPAVATVELRRSAAVSIADLREQIEHGQTVARYTLEGRDGAGAWQRLSTGTTIGHCKLDRFAPVTIRQVRLTLDEAVGAPRPIRIRLFADVRA